VIAIIAWAKSTRKFQADGQRKSETEASMQSANVIVSSEGEPFEPWSSKFVNDGIDSVDETLNSVVDGGTKVWTKKRKWMTVRIAGGICKKMMRSVRVSRSGNDDKTVDGATSEDLPLDGLRSIL
jgi:hypothetical protein